MGGFEGFKLKLILWHIQNVRSPKQEEIKDVPMLRQRQKNIATCPTTGQPHLFHHAHWHEGKLYYKGNVVAEKELAL
jgi:ribosomal protein L32